MRIGELATKAGLTAKTIRFYETAGVLPEPERQPSGYRDYNGSALARLRFVKAAQAAGLTLAEIRQVIAVRDLSGPPCRHVADLLDTHAADLDRRIAELAALRDDVQRLRDRAKSLDPSRCDDTAVCHVIPADDPAAHPPARIP
ncbi:heavy metal-responsive transcriptional regulator [Klenkia terrae]|uniref:heavy metal-responsive transcriptional regulator n=1 Tax=Klenkia terrae TaxID=1052259 RepID=UPI001CD91207|nr:heavy metal-responsive transcriptional regulator [Klenkia terrae]